MKNNNRSNKQISNFARAAHFFVHFFAVVLQDYNHRVTKSSRGYKGLHRLQGITKASRVTKSFKGLLTVTRGYERLQEVTKSYKGLQGVTRGYKGLRGVTGGYKRLQGVTRNDRE